MTKHQKPSAPRHSVAYKTADRLHSTAIRLLRLLRLQDKASGVGPARLSALSVLVFAGSQSLNSLAEIEQVKQPTMSRVVAGLEKSGLAVVRRDTKDARRMIITVTKRGLQSLQAARVKRVAFLAERLSTLTSAELQALHNADAILRNALAARSSP